MPNHITNILEINAYEHRGVPNGTLDAVLEAVKSDDRPFDFNRLIPRPESLDVTSGTVQEGALALHDDTQALKMLNWAWVQGEGISDIEALRDRLRKRYAAREDKEKDCPTLDDFAAKLRANIDRYGHADWYSWSCANWGTKWNAYSAVAGKVDETTAVIHFETAWSPPMPVLDELARRFPTVNFRLIWCDEGDDRQHRIYWDGGKRDSDD